MKMQKSLMTVLAAGACVATSAQAQDMQTPLPIGGKITVGFVDRTVNVPVYDALRGSCPNVAVAALGAGGSYIMEDVSFAPGPWGPAHTGARDVNVIAHMFQTGGWTGTPVYPDTGTPTASLTHIFEFYEPGAFSAVPMLSNPVAIGTFTGNVDVGSDFAWTVTYPVATPIALGTRQAVWVATRGCISATTTRIADAASVPANNQPAGQTAVTYGPRFDNSVPCAGASTFDYGRDSNGNDIFSGGAAALTGANIGNVNDWRTIAGVHQSLQIQGFAKAAAPTPNFTFCNLADGLTTQALTVPAGNNIVWVKICLAANVDDETLRFLNIDSEGSGEALSFGLYNAGGAVVGFDNGSGSGTNSQLTYGVGRSAGALPDGTQYDGRDGELVAGDYYLAIAAPGTTFGGAFSVNAAAATGVASTLQISTNVNAGGSLPTAQAPVPDHFDHSALGAFTFPAVDTFAGQSPDTIPGPTDDNSDAVLWSKITVGAPGAVAGSNTYMDVDSAASDIVDSAMFVFNTNGDLVAFNDDQIALTNFNSALSFGATSPGRNAANGQLRDAGNDPTFAWAGQNGDLAAGDYYVAVLAWPFDVIGGQAGAAPVVPTAGARFHARGLSGDNVGLTLDFYTGTVVGGPVCDSIDFNNDGLFPDTLDIDDFLSVFSGGPCSNDPLCGDIDFNNDGLFPDTLDVDSLLSVFSGGPCL
jgi:hypothetical protein